MSEKFISRMLSSILSAMSIAMASSPVDLIPETALIIREPTVRRMRNKIEVDIIISIRLKPTRFRRLCIRTSFLFDPLFIIAYNGQV